MALATVWASAAAAATTTAAATTAATTVAAAAAAAAAATAVAAASHSRPVCFFARSSCKYACYPLSRRLLQICLLP